MESDELPDRTEIMDLGSEEELSPAQDAGGQPNEAEPLVSGYSRVPEETASQAVQRQDEETRLLPEPILGSQPLTIGVAPSSAKSALLPVTDQAPARQGAIIGDQAILERSRSLWREVEPEDRTDYVQHMAAATAVGGNGTRLVAASRRGRAHGHDGKYREDSFAIHSMGDWLLAAVADGAGSKPLSRVGARVATAASISYLRQGLRRTTPACDMGQSLRGVLAGAMVYALARINEEAICRRRDPDDFACTLILVILQDVVGTQWIGVAQVGDGGVVLQLADGSSTFLGEADRGTYAGEAVFLTSQEAQLSWPKRVQVYQVSQPIRLLVAGTDGVIDDFTPPFGDTASLFAGVGPPAARGDAQALQEWLGYERRGSFDDRTLVVFAPAEYSLEAS